MKKLITSVLCATCVLASGVFAGPGHNHGAGASHTHAKGEAHTGEGGSAHGAGHSHAQKGGHSHSEGHSHGHAGEKKEAGPNGGRVIHSVEPHAEFFVNKDRKVQITFLDEQGKAIAPAGQSVTVTTGSRTNPLRLAFTQEEGVLISDAALPQGNRFPIVLQIRAAGSDAVAVTERFTADLSQCPTCSYAEYACICEGHG